MSPSPHVPLLVPFLLEHTEYAHLELDSPHTRGRSAGLRVLWNASSPEGVLRSACSWEISQYSTAENLSP